MVDVNGNGLIETSEQPNPNIVQDLFGWRDVSHKYNELMFTGGLAIGRQWLLWDKLALDIQIGPQYKYMTRSERTFNEMTLGMLIMQLGKLEIPTIFTQILGCLQSYI